MSDAITTDPQIAETRSDAADMAKYGITRKTTDVFYLGEYRYTNLRDAIAQGKRMATTT